MHPDRGVQLKNYRRALEGSGEVSIGAYARRARRRRLGVALLGLALLGGSFVAYRVLADGVAGPAEPEQVFVRCRACDHNFRLPVNSRRDYPVTCPECSAHAGDLLWQCRDCELIFLPATPHGRIACPRCDSVRTGHVKSLQRAGGE